MGLNETTVLRVQIDQLILNGIHAGHPDRVIEAFQQELTRLLTAHGLPTAPPPGRQDRPLPPTRDPRRLGRQLALSVHAALVADEGARTRDRRTR